jgi:hypothetical protein
MDDRLKRLSHSSLSLLHSCPRKYELTKLSDPEALEDLEDLDIKQKLTFDFGAMVGDGCQKVLAGVDLETITFLAFSKWSTGLYDFNPIQKKSFFHALIAIEQFKHLYDSGAILADYKLYSEDSCELSFRIKLPNDFTYRGFVDAVVKNSASNKVAVLEFKTSSATNISSALYQNSFQGIGYSIVLDKLAPGLQNYTVYYPVYCTKKSEWEIFEFEKSYAARAIWIRQLLLDVEIVSLYHEQRLFPTNGNSCYSFYKECAWFGVCHLENRNLVSKIKVTEPEPDGLYQYELTLAELITAQERNLK